MGNSGQMRFLEAKTAILGIEFFCLSLCLAGPVPAAESVGTVEKPIFEPGRELIYPYEPSSVVFHQVGTGQIRDVYARDFRSYGIWLRKDNFMCEVNSCITSGNDKAGVYLLHNSEGGRGGNHVPNIVIGCKSYGEDGQAYELVRST